MRGPRRLKECLHGVWIKQIDPSGANLDQGEHKDNKSVGVASVAPPRLHSASVSVYTGHSSLPGHTHTRTQAEEMGR